MNLMENVVGDNLGSVLNHEKMKVLLINPTGGPEEEYGTMSKAGSELPQLGLASVATAILSAGYQAKIIDYSINRMTLRELFRRIKNEGFSIIGFSVYVTTVKNTKMLSDAIKKEFPEITICVGGPQVTLSPYDFSNMNVDYVFIGEADRTIIELIDALAQGTSTLEIEGVLSKIDGKLCGNPKLNLIHNLDELPFVQLDKLYDLSGFYPPIHIKGKKVINVSSVRGCPYSCTFCAAAEVNGRKLRFMSANRFVDLLEYYVGLGFDSFMIYDDTFTINKKRAKKIAREIIKRKLNIHWNCWSRVDCVDIDTLSYMYESGCYYLMYGCESMNDKTLKKLKKGFTVEQAINGINIAKQSGLLVSSSFMVGLPGETYDDIMNTIKTVNKTKLDIALYPIFEPYRGTPIYSDCKAEGVWKKGRFKNNLLIDQDEVWEPNTISREELVKISRYAFRSFYLRPHFVVSFLKIFQKLPLKRKIKLLTSGYDFFILNQLRPKRRKYNMGSRFE